MSKSSQMPSLEDLEKRYGEYLSDPGFASASDRCLPNTGNPTDERKVLADLEEQNDEAFMENLKKRVRETTPGL